MTERRSPLLPPRLTPPGLDPRPDGHHDVFQAARARRRRKAAIVGTTSVLILGVALSLGQSGGSNDTLQPISPAGTRDDQTSSDQRGNPAPPLPGPLEGTTAGPAPAAPDTDTQPGAVPQQAPHSPGQPPASSATASDMRRTLVDYEAGECTGNGVGGDRGWCTRWVGPASTRRGVPVDLTFEVCRLDVTADVLRFSSTKEIDYSLRAKTTSPSRTFWRWSTGRRFTTRETSLTVPARMCARWTTTWSTRVDDGTLAAPGQYLLNYALHMSFGDDGPPSAYVDVDADRQFTIQ